MTDRIDYPTLMKQALLELQALRCALDTLEQARTEPIAVLGLGCRFPGADSPEAFWDLLQRGGDAIAELPPDRWDLARYYDPDPNALGKVSTRFGGFLGQVDQFDALFFGMAPREVVTMDPQQRLLLEVSWEALEQAGQAVDRLVGSPTGVFIGVSTTDYADLQLQAPDPAAAIDPYFGTGTSASAIAGRLSYLLGLQGPSLVVDTACSSSLVAVHLACQSLRSGESRMALAGGVNLLLAPYCTVATSRMHLMAPDGRCKTFDARANGYVRSEGCGVVVLKRLSDAQADGDPILAVIRGSAVNQDGPSGALTIPNGPAQQAVIRQALTQAGVHPTDISYVEAHGTGTALGDPIELQALVQVLGAERKEPLIIGSVKTNIGHLEAAAGVAGLIKTILALHHRQIPPHLHFQTPNPHIAWAGLPVLIPQQPTPWPTTEPLAGVSAFSFVGTNAHVVVQGPPALPDRAQASIESPCAHGQLLVLSAKSPASLQALIRSYREWLCGPQVPTLADLCYSAAVRRSHHPLRLALVGHTVPELVEQLAAWREPLPKDRKSSGVPEIVFVFSGQGPRWSVLEEQVRSQPVFRAALERCDRLLRPYTGWSLLEILDAEQAPLESSVQPVLFAVQVALTELWRSWGIEPDAVVGHSVGEVAAAYAAGVLTLEDAIHLIYHRSRLTEQSGPGTMAAVGLSLAQAQELVDRYGGRVGVAAVNSPTTTVLWGEAQALAQILQTLGEQEVFARLLPVEHPFHSPQMEPLAEELVRWVAGIEPQPAVVPMYSTVTGKTVTGSDLGAGYWGRNLREPVRFADAVQGLVASGHRLFLELNIHPVLGAPLKQCFKAWGQAGETLASLQNAQGAWTTLLASLGRLYELGYSVDWSHVYPSGTFTPLPAYPWSRERYWITTPEREPLVLSKEEMLQPAHLLRDLTQRWGDDDTQAINSRFLAPFIFLGRARTHCFHFNRTAKALLVTAYVGAPESYTALAQELLAYAAARGWGVNFLVKEERVAQLKALGYSVTPIGVWQSLLDLSSFGLQGNAMRRLRYQVSHYEKQGTCTTSAYRIGTEPQQDQRIVDLIDAWANLKRTTAPFISWLKVQILAGTLPPEHRVFLTQRDGILDSAILLSPAGAKNGYLMDLEFYQPDIPLGALEFGIAQILEHLRAEGYTYFSLGATLGTQLSPDADADPEVVALFARLHEQKILNGDGNFQFKNKFRPETTGFYLCRALVEPTDVQTVFTLLTQPTQVRPSPELVPIARQTGTGHPLLGQQLRLALRDTVFETQLSLQNLPFLLDHQGAGQVLFPAAAYLEMVLAAAAAVFGHRKLQQVKLRQPLALSITEARTVQMVLSPEASGTATFQVLSLPEGRDWILHATGQVTAPDASPLDSCLVEQIQARCQEVSVQDHYRQLQGFGLEYGPSFRGVERLWCREGEALGQIALPPTLEPAPYQIHPALLDACMQVLAASLPKTAAGVAQIHLPVGLASLEVYGPVGTRLWSHALLHSDPTETLVTGDLVLYADRGRVVARVQGLQVKRTDSALLSPLPQEPWRDGLYTVQWQPQPSSAGAVKRSLAPWLICMDPQGIGEALALALVQAGAQVALVYPGQAFRVLDEGMWEVDPEQPEHYQRLLRALGSCAGVIYLWGTEPTPTLSSALHWVQTLAKQGTGKLWLVTQGAQALAREALVVHQAPLWGFGRVLAQEHPERWGGLIDLDPQVSGSEAACTLVEELLNPDQERQLAFRKGQRHVARLVKYDVPSTTQPLSLPPDGTYLITGGLGALGLQVARWLVQQGARQLVLVGRRGVDPATQSVLDQIQALGAQVLVLQADIAQAPEVARILEKIALALPPLKGIVHAAGVLDDGVLLQQNGERFAGVLAPKVQGAWHLHQLTRAQPLDFFVLFSSMAAVLGPRGQGSYAAANAFLDALAHQRRAEGLPGLSINWSAWAQGGMAAKLDPRDQQRLTDQGLRTIPPELGLQILGQALAQQWTQVGVMPVEWAVFAQQFVQGTLPPLLSGLVQAPARPLSLKETLLTAADGLPLIEDQISRLVAQVLRLPPSQVSPERPLTDLGLDSLMAIELGDQIQAHCGVSVPLAQFFQEVSIAQLAQQVLEQLTTAPRPAMPEPAPPRVSPDNAADLLDQLDQLSNEEVNRLLSALLAQEEPA
ncbi:type I polyketide synthase [Anthocerotibacter panamensis]|uniref:type I polyketide synthase n=1 Tax=Anthocerotibacter panamensis TaxID=2857077 RepID=UPI001C401883|nr:type I polyketide synthase [Anthocerotibacter panamensis]